MTCQPQTDPVPERALALRAFLSPLQVFLDEPTITELALMRPGSVFVRRHGRWESHACPDVNQQQLAALINALTIYNGLTPAALLAVMLPDGQRCQIAQPPACLHGEVAISIRQHARQAPRLEAWQTRDALSALTSEPLLTAADRCLQHHQQRRDWVGFLHEALRQRRNIIVAGATGSGKTTLARSLIARVPREQRLITLEDVHELSLPEHPNHVHLLYGTGPAQVSASDCLKACLRLSPDRILLAELRGPETWDYLAALNTGHPGSITTTHANSAADTLKRLAMLIKQSPAGNHLDWHTIEHFLLQTIDIVLFLQQHQLRQVWFEPARRLTASPSGLF